MLFGPNPSNDSVHGTHKCCSAGVNNTSQRRNHRASIWPGHRRSTAHMSVAQIGHQVERFWPGRGFIGPISPQLASRRTLEWEEEPLSHPTHWQEQEETRWTIVAGVFYVVPRDLCHVMKPGALCWNAPHTSRSLPLGLCFLSLCMWAYRSLCRDSWEGVWETGQQMWRTVRADLEASRDALERWVWGSCA